MGKTRISKGKARVLPAALCAVALAVAIPGASLAVAPSQTAGSSSIVGALPFTPAGSDPQLARRVADLIGEDALRFTPASKPAAETERTINFAVRVDAATARSLSGRAPMAPLASAGTVESSLPIAPTRYNLGTARGFQSFAQPTRSVSAAVAASGNELKGVAMPDLGKFDSDDDDGKPSRFQSRIALEREGNAGSSPLTLEGAGTQRVDVGGSYRLGRNLDVTAGVRLKQDRDRLGPLTDGIEDDQAVYVGTQIRF